MSDDLIKRSDAIKAFTFNLKGERIPFVDCDNFPVEFPLRYIVDTLAALPSADRPQGEWIPCSERLPQYRDVVLVSTFWGVRVAERDGIKEDGTDDFWYLFLNDATAHPRYVYAWMPLPKPWKGADDERLNKEV